MIEIEEIKKGNSRYYNVSTYSKDNRLISKRTVHYTLKSTFYKKIRCYMLFDSNGNCLENVFRFINMYKVSAADTSREKYIQYLRYLYEFSEIIDKDVSKFQRNDIDKLVVFLSGYDPNSSLADNFYTYSNKSEETVAAVFSVIKEYVDYCGYASSRYFQNFRGIKKRINEKKKNNAICPKFISVREMKSILNYISNDTLLDKETKMKYTLIFKLMFNKGLRIGEVLGITLEDFEEIYSSEGDLYYRLYIRNRMSDNADQRAKRCLSMDGQYSYNAAVYHRLDIGYQQVFLSEEFHDDIIEYFDMASARFRSEKKLLSKADAVDGLSENWYIFYNRNRPTPLSKDILYKYTREMFRNLNIHVDRYVRTNNLFHRFRHGFCMYLLYVENMSPLEACKLTRHRNAESLAIYNNPTEDMLADMMIQIEEGTEFYGQNQTIKNKEEHQ